MDKPISDQELLQKHADSVYVKRKRGIEKNPGKQNVTPTNRKHISILMMKKTDKDIITKEGIQIERERERNG